ncbi:MAG: VOC family protein [Pseudomonadota bacterium]
MQRAFTSILSQSVENTAAFYENLLGMTRHFDSAWFIILTHPDLPGLEYGILQRDHDIVPEAARAAPAGVVVTFVVADCDAAFAKAQTMDAPILQPPTDMPYGQRRLLLKDPDGTVVDVSAPTVKMV